MYKIHPYTPHYSYRKKLGKEVFLKCLRNLSESFERYYNIHTDVTKRFKNFDNFWTRCGNNENIYLLWERFGSSKIVTRCKTQKVYDPG